MFKEIVAMTPMTNSAANSYFKERIYGDEFRGDNSVVATLRALLDKRMPAGNKLYATFDSIDASSASRVAAHDDFWSDTFMIINCRVSEAESEEVFRKIGNDMKKLPNWQQLDKVSAFFRKLFRVSCFVNQEKRDSFLVVENLDTRRLHYLQRCVLGYFPWYFDRGDSVSELEMELMDSLKEKTPDKYLTCMARVAETYDFQTQAIKRMLSGFSVRYEKTILDRARTSLERIERQIASLNEQISTSLDQRRDAINNIFGLEMKIAAGNDDHELEDWFLAHKRIVTLDSVNNDEIQFTVRTYFDNFDESAAERVINNDRSFMYMNCGTPRSGIISPAEMKELMTEIFLKQNLKIMVCSAIKFGSSRVSALVGHSYGPEYDTFMPNPHHERYDCFGDNLSIINGRLRDRDYVGAIEQTIAACKNLNFNDSTVMAKFVGLMYGTDTSRNNRCIQLPDGSVVDPKGAVEYLRKKKEEKKGEEVHG